MAVWPAPFARSGPLSDDPPVPIAATLAFGTGVWTVTFDKTLQPGVLVPGNWTFRANDFTLNATAATATAATVVGTSSTGAPDIGPDAANYDATPADVLDLESRPAAAFADFPLVVT